MREIDRRSKIDRRNFLKTAGAVPPAMAVAATTGLSIDGAWADNAQALKPDTMKTLAQLARDIYPHDHLADRYYIAAVTPWDAMATSDAKLKALMEEGIAFLNQSAHAAYKVPYRAVAWEEQRVASCAKSSKPSFSARCVAICSSRSTTITRCGRSSDTRARRLSTAGTSIAASMTSTG
jgi:hypothetical protein